MAKVLVIGAEGMLGHKMYQVLRQLLPEVGCTIRGRLKDWPYRGVELFDDGEVIEGVDLLETGDLREALFAHCPSVIVNCAGLIKQRPEAAWPIPSIKLNSLLPHVIAEAADGWGGRLIHFSTDCVFSGRRGQYRESDPADAEDLYGKTKHLGEVSGANCLTLRTSIIGREIQGFRSLLEWFLGQKGMTINGYTRHYYSGVTTNYLAELVAKLILERPDLRGLYQVTSQTISKYDLLLLLRAAYGIDVVIQADESTFCDRSMIGEKFLSATGYRQPGWEQLVSELVADETPYESWR